MTAPNHDHAEQAAVEATIAADIARLNEGSEPCQGDYCEGRGRTVEAGEDCGYCNMIEHSIWEAGEPA